MRASELAAVEKRLEVFLEGLTGFMGRRDRRGWAGAYVRGLLLDGERKSVEPMAMRLGKSDQGLQQFVNQSPWSAASLLEGLARKNVTSPTDHWIIDETSFPKAGEHSVGVQRQYCGALGKKANCQIAVSLHRAEEVLARSQPISWRLYLPEGWTGDAPRRQRAGIPAALTHRSKLDLALDLLDEAIGWGLPAGVVLADEAYGGSFEWRAALRARELAYAVRVPWTTTGWVEEPSFGPPAPAGKGRPPRRLRLLSAEPVNLLGIARDLPLGAWKSVTWRQGSKGAQRSRFTTFRLWAANGWRQGPQPSRVEEIALVEWPTGESAPTRYWLARLGQKRVSLRRLVATAKARWRVEQDYRELKEELGLDHFEGRSWTGWQHHVALVTTAFAFLREEQRRRTRRAQKKAAPAQPAADQKTSSGRPHPAMRPMSLVPHPLRADT